MIDWFQKRRMRPIYFDGTMSNGQTVSLKHRVGPLTPEEFEAKLEELQQVVKGVFNTPGAEGSLCIGYKTIKIADFTVIEITGG